MAQIGAKISHPENQLNSYVLACQTDHNLRRQSFDALNSQLAAALDVVEALKIDKKRPRLCLNAAKIDARASFYAQEVRGIARLFRQHARQTNGRVMHAQRGERLRLQKICQQAIRLFAEECVPELKRVHAVRVEQTVAIFEVLKTIGDMTEALGEFQNAVVLKSDVNK